jgi:hypothetical protein
VDICVKVFAQATFSQKFPSDLREIFRESGYFRESNICKNLLNFAKLVNFRMIFAFSRKIEKRIFAPILAFTFSISRSNSAPITPQRITAVV